MNWVKTKKNIPFELCEKQNNMDNDNKCNCSTFKVI